jgi:hypothetical protein
MHSVKKEGIAIWGLARGHKEKYKQICAEVMHCAANRRLSENAVSEL